MKHVYPINRNEPAVSRTTSCATCTSRTLRSWSAATSCSNCAASSLSPSAAPSHAASPPPRWYSHCHPRRAQVRPVLHTLKLRAPRMRVEAQAAARRACSRFIARATNNAMSREHSSLSTPLPTEVEQLLTSVFYRANIIAATSAIFG